MINYHRTPDFLWQDVSRLKGFSLNSWPSEMMEAEIMIRMTEIEFMYQAWAETYGNSLYRPMVLGLEIRWQYSEIMDAARAHVSHKPRCFEYHNDEEWGRVIPYLTDIVNQFKPSKEFIKSCRTLAPVTEHPTDARL